MIDCKLNELIRLAEGRSRRFGRRIAAFTLIELLVVIAIISILIAILFPVFSSVLENNREANSMAHMAQIQSALALYQLDNKRYPDVLFAYAPSGSDTCTATDMTNIGAASGCSKELVGLYPAYVSDWHVFTNLNNNIDDPSATVTLPVNSMNGRTMNPASQPTKQQTFFKMDAYDISPQITGVNRIADPDGSGYVVRYQTSWTDYTPTGSGDSYSTLCFPDGSYANGSCNTALTTTADLNYDPDYSRQLRWSSPPPNTYVTAVTDHVPNANRILVLYLDGTVKKINFQDGWQNPLPGTSGASAVGDSPGTSNYTTFEQSFNDSQTDIGAVPVNAANSSVYESKAGFWRTLLGRGEH